MQLMNLVEANLTDSSFNLNDEQLRFKDEIKYLGVMIDKDLRFDKHLDFLEEKVDESIELINIMDRKKKGFKFYFKKEIYKREFI